MKQAFALVACIAACGGDSSGAGSDASAIDGAASASDASQQLPQGPGLAGFMRLTDGEPLANEQVLACMDTTCLFGDTNSNGFFFFEIEPSADVALKTIPAPFATPRLGAAMCPIDIRDSTLVYVESLYVPIMPQGVNFGPAADDPQTLSVADDLTLTLNRGDLKPRLGDTLLEAAAVAVPEEQRCSQLVIPGEEIIGVYALHPFGATSSSPIAISVASTLPEGTPVFFRSIDEIQGDLSEPALGHADGQLLTSDPGQGIQELSWLVISY
jgi:hypothetical protein